MTLPLNILAPARPSPRSVLQGSEEGCYSADRTYAPVVIRALGGFSYDPSSCSQPGSSADLRMSPASSRHPSLLLFVTLLCGTTYTIPRR
jgi:hypothetical protein